MHLSNLRLSPAILAAVFISAAAPGQGPLAMPETPHARLDWVETDKPPAWLTVSKRDPGTFSFSTGGLGSAHQIAIIRAKKYCQSQARAALTEHLLPVLGQEHTTPTVDAMLEHSRLAEALYEATRPAPNGAPYTVASAYLRWQVPIRKIIEQVEPELQGRVEWLLLRDPVKWQAVKEVPEWTHQLPKRAGHFRFVLTHEDSPTKAARHKALRSARADAQSYLTKALAEVTEAPLTQKAIAAGCNRLTPVRKANYRRWVPVKGEEAKKTRQVTTTYVLWEIPLSSLTSALPAEVRPRAIAALEQAMQAGAK